MWAAIKVARRLDADKTVLVLLPDTGRGYLSKVYNDAWLRENGFLDRLPIEARVRELVNRHSREIPMLVTVSANKTVREAIDLLQQYNISQFPVTRPGTDGTVEVPFHDVHSMVGSIQERNLLERVFRDPGIIDSKVEDVMDQPFPLMDVAEPVETRRALAACQQQRGTCGRGWQARRLDHSERPAGVCGARSRRLVV